jgi:long-chain acyl-CoA synthetase
MSGRSPDTFPLLLKQQAAERPDHPAVREKDLGIWQSWTWSQVNEEVRALACWLAELGFRRGDNLAIIGDNRPRLYWAMAAAQSLGGVPVPMYQDAVAQEMLFVLQDAEIRFAIVEDQEQVDKNQEQCRSWRILLTTARMRHYDQPFARPDRVQDRRAHARQRIFIDAEIGKGSPTTAIMLYTSGTTGAKGVCLTHAFIVAVRAASASTT